MTKQEMMDKVIRVYGFESKEAIHFCELAENPLHSATGILRVWFMELMIPVGESF